MSKRIVIAVDGGVDYRLRQLTAAPIYLASDAPGTRERLEQLFDDLSDEDVESDGTISVHSRKIKVVFADGEVIVGTTQGYQPSRPGFFMVPADSAVNNIDRCYVVAASTSEVTLL